MAAIGPRSGARRRRAMSEINMVPFIDVMLVLLIIFMVSAPLITTGMVDLPSVGRAQQRPPRVVEVVIGADERLQLRVNQQEAGAVALPQLVAKVREAQGGLADAPVVISADRKITYEAVMRVMDALQRGGVARVGLAVRHGGA